VGVEIVFRFASTLALAFVLGFSACGGNSSGSATSGTAPTATALSLPAQVGKKLFFDTHLSASGKVACSTCHDPRFAYGPPNALAVQLGGATGMAAGIRTPPSLRYKDYTPAYADLLDNPDGISQPGPGGGFNWDGRADSLAAQAAFPLLATNEMANASANEVVKKIQNASYAPLFLQAFGAQAFADVQAAFANATAALQAFQLEDPSFHPYSSKFDLYAAVKIGGTLTAAETRGFKVFTDPAKGNCASCHYQGAGLNGSSALFTDFSYEAIGVPRNASIPANADASFFDLGICGPARTDHPAVAGNAFCGMFKTPTLRNLASRQAFFHNGVMHSLEQVIRWYNTRDTHPEIWYPTVGGTPKPIPDAGFPGYGLVTTQYTGGTVQKFNDLPTPFAVNIDLQMPLDSRPVGSTPTMTEQNISDLLCFLNTLNDRDVAPPPSADSCVN
jgi:cytochrome c peroxidase